MAHDMYIYVERCPDCRRRRRYPTYQRLIRLILLDAPLEFMFMDIPGPLPRIKSGNRLVVIIIDRYDKLTWAIPTKTQQPNMSSSHFWARG